MYSGDIRLTNPRGVSYSISNDFDNVMKLKDAIEDAKDAKSLAKELSKLDSIGHKWEVDKDNSSETRFKKSDKLGNITYLIAAKDGSGDKSIYSRKCRLTNDKDINLSLDNEFNDTSKVSDAIEAAKDAKSLCQAINKLDAYKNKWSIDKDTNKETRLSKKDAWGNNHYLIVVKEAFDKINVPDLSSTPMTPAGVGGGMPTRWVYSEYGRFLSVYGIRNGISIVFNLASAEDIQSKMQDLYKKRDNGLVDNMDLQELEERLRVMSNITIYGNGTEDQSGVALQEEVNPETSPAKLAHMRRIQPLSHTDEANKKRRKTIEAKREAKLLGLNEDDLEN